MKALNLIEAGFEHMRNTERHDVFQKAQVAIKVYYLFKRMVIF